MLNMPCLKGFYAPLVHVALIVTAALQSPDKIKQSASDTKNPAYVQEKINKNRA